MKVSLSSDVFTKFQEDEFILIKMDNDEDLFRLKGIEAYVFQEILKTNDLGMAVNEICKQHNYDFSEVETFSIKLLKKLEAHHLVILKA